MKQADKNTHKIDHQNKHEEGLHGHSHGHVPEYLRIFGQNTELYFSIISGIFWLVGMVAPYLGTNILYLPTTLFIISAIFGGVFTVYTALLNVVRGRFEIDFLMLIAAIGAAFLGKWGESALLLFLFSLGHALEDYAMRRARKSIAALSDLAPPTALVRRNGELVKVDIEDLKRGEIIVVKPNSKIAADGVVIKGSSAVNQSSITGESVPVDKFADSSWEEREEVNQLTAEHRVFSGTINGSGALEIKVLKEAKDSTISRLITLVQEAEKQKSPTQHFTDKIEKYYVPLVIIFVIMLMFAYLVIDETFQESFYRAMTVLIAASPCALAISTPSAILSGISRAAQKGVLFKGGRPLEELGRIKAIAFDKTGTLTEGRPKLTHIIPFHNVSKEQLLTVAVAVEDLSDHPLASAIVEAGKKELGNAIIPVATNLEALTARGIQAVLEGETVYIGNRRLAEEVTGKIVPEEIDSKMSNLEEDGHTAMIVLQKHNYLGILGVMDVARPEAKATLSTLKNMGIERMVMLTGDHQQVANTVARNIGITDPMGSLLPEDKVNAIKKLREEVGSVAMVGDGVNDAPAMATSNVGIAMGAAGSDVALETAEIALMEDKLRILPFAIGLSRKANSIVKQNIFISIGVVAILVPLTLIGYVAIGPAVVAHEGSTLVVALNALRLLRFTDGLKG